MSGDNESDLAVELRRLWAVAERRAGAQIKVGTFARELFISPSSLYAYLAGTTLPPLLVLDRIVQALGATPAEQCRVTELHEAAGTRQRARRRRSPVVSPCQLPPAVRYFTGRSEQLAELNALALEPSAVALVSGTAGVGKTALVAHWAHRVRDRFADGMLYVDLRGFDPEQPLEPGHVLGTFLRGLGEAGDTLPGDLAERTALFRARLDRRQVLIFLDNAVSEEQVRPLLPNSPQSMVVVTSRNTLPGLVARDGAHRVHVPSMPVADAVTLLRLLIGTERVGADAHGAAALVERCARLPLAIRIGADLATTRRRATLTDLADELLRYHLDLFSAGGDERTAIRTVFSWSYLHLRTDRARAFRLLGLHPGRDLDVYTCAALLDTGLAEADERAGDLVRANLLEVAGDGRYRMHDLLRAYAREQATPDESAEAMGRLLDHYLGTAATAMSLALPDDRRPVSSAPRVIHPLKTRDEAMAWLDAERRNLLTLAEVATNEDWPVCAVHMSALLCDYLHNRAHYTDAMTLHTLALKVARNNKAVALEGWEVSRIGIVHMRLGHHVEARDHLSNALSIAREVGDTQLEARASLHLAQVSRPESALPLLRSALPLTRTVCDRHLEGHVLTSLAVTHNALGHPDEALRHHEAAAALAVHLNDDDLTAHVLNNLGTHHHQAGSPAAETYHRHALRLARAAGNPALEATSLLRLGESLHHRAEALIHLANALRIALSIGDTATVTETYRLLAKARARLVTTLGQDIP